MAPLVAVIPGNRPARSGAGMAHMVTPAPARRALLNNMVKGVSEGFSKTLQLNGVGYRASVDGKDLLMNLGYSHPVRIPIPEGINVSVRPPRPTCAPTCAVSCPPASCELRAGAAVSCGSVLTPPLCPQVNRLTTVLVDGYNNEVLGQFCADVRSRRPPEPYKGKGIKYSDEVIRRKDGKRR